MTKGLDIMASKECLEELGQEQKGHKNKNQHRFMKVTARKSSNYCKGEHSVIETWER